MWPAFLNNGDSMCGAAVKISERREKSLTASSHAGRMVNPKIEGILQVAGTGLQKLEEFSRTRIGLRADLFGVLQVGKGLEDNNKDNRNDLKFINSWETGLPLNNTSRISTITP